MASFKALLCEAEAELFKSVQSSLRSVHFVHGERHSVNMTFGLDSERELFLSLDTQDLRNLVEASEDNSWRLQQLTAQLQKEWETLSPLAPPSPVAGARSTPSRLAQLEIQLGDLRVAHAAHVEQQIKTFSARQSELEDARALFEQACRSYGTVEGAVVAAAQECARLHCRMRAQWGMRSQDALSTAIASPSLSSSLSRAIAPASCAALTKRLGDAYQRHLQTSPAALYGLPVTSVQSLKKEASPPLRFAVPEERTMSIQSALSELQRRAQSLLAKKWHVGASDGDMDDDAPRSKRDFQRTRQKLFEKRDLPTEALSACLAAPSPHNCSSVSSGALFERKRGSPRAAMRQETSSVSTERDSASHRGAAISIANNHLEEPRRSAPSAPSHTVLVDDGLQAGEGIGHAPQPAQPHIDAWALRELCNASEADKAQALNAGEAPAMAVSAAEEELALWRARLGVVYQRLQRSLQRPIHTGSVVRETTTYTDNVLSSCVKKTATLSVPRQEGVALQDKASRPAATSLLCASVGDDSDVVEAELSRSSTESVPLNTLEVPLPAYSGDNTSYRKDESDVKLARWRVMGDVGRAASRRQLRQCTPPMRHRCEIDALALQHMRLQIKGCVANLLQDTGTFSLQM